MRPDVSAKVMERGEVRAVQTILMYVRPFGAREMQRAGAACDERCVLGSRDWRCSGTFSKDCRCRKLAVERSKGHLEASNASWGAGA